MFVEYVFENLKICLKVFKLVKDIREKKWGTTASSAVLITEVRP